ncbi:MAG TPA: beta-1,3-glucanase family protein [Streptosporangiaceae bacterium]|nr:beta-1,3-glucanase family protein [Streptosporangiaceae bacterium]
MPAVGAAGRSRAALDGPIRSHHADFGCGGTLAGNPPLCAGLNRHVAQLPASEQSNPGNFYQAAPANCYAQFWHSSAINGLQYGFPYDDAGQSSDISVSNPRYLVGRRRLVVILVKVDMRVMRYSERPELWASISDLPAQVWPEYNRHGEVLNRYWGRLYDAFPEWQFVLFDAGAGQVLAEGHAIPVAWDGTDAGLGPGIDATITAGFALRSAGGRPAALSALAAEIPPAHRGRGLSALLLQVMSGLARQAGLRQVIAPVRPSLKGRYPTIPIERYARWTRPDGSPFDPWVRVHARLGARLGPAIPRSLHITGTVAEWESWTQLRFPETGDYVFPAGLATVHIDRDRDAGDYWEPNIWIIHPPADTATLR